MTHTPTPWAVTKSRRVESSSYVVNLTFINPETHTAPAKALGTTAEKATANAAFIVRAVNSHGAMIQALEGLANWIDSDPSAYDGDDDHSLGRAMAEARAALAKAKAEP